jgi:hypothetical protein
VVVVDNERGPRERGIPAGAWTVALARPARMPALPGAALRRPTRGSYGLSRIANGITTVAIKVSYFNPLLWLALASGSIVAPGQRGDAGGRRLGWLPPLRINSGVTRRGPAC